MNQEYKQLLIKDLSGRLPYRNNVRLMVQEFDEDAPSTRLLRTEYIDDIENDWLLVCKPYLRQMDSMTEDEIYEIQTILGNAIEIRPDFINYVEAEIHTISFLELQAVFDFLNKNNFDYNELIPKGLAEIAPEGMYN
jgi:hypothetical protein